jgi:predicted ATP-grasp superfamily ATP-dependent carboligase
MTTVLCTNGLLSKTLAVVRSLGSKDIKVIVSESTRFHTSGFSKYCSKTLLSPNPTKEPIQYVEWLKETIQMEKIDIVFAMDDDTIDVISTYLSELDKLCVFPIPSRESYLISADKSETMKLAAIANVPCPQTITTLGLDDLNEQGLLKLIQDYDFPVVIKPRMSNGSRGFRIVETKDQLWRVYSDIHESYPYPMIQEYIPSGVKYDICLCYDSKHELKASFVQKQIRNYPINRGPSTVHESVIYPELVELSKKLLTHIPWYGVADIEFMIDPRNGRPILLEINPRFWSSVHLSIRCGVDFPWILYQLAMGKEVPIKSEYVTGRRGRSLLPGDVLHFISNPKRWSMDPPLWTTSLPDDMVSVKDPLPTLGFIMSALRYCLNKEAWKFLVRR